jgi:hypothetical protein
VGRPIKRRQLPEGKLVGAIVGNRSFAVIGGETPKTVLLTKLESELVCGDHRYGRVRPVLPDFNAQDALVPHASRARKEPKGSRLRFRHKNSSYEFWGGEDGEAYGSD